MTILVLIIISSSPEPFLSAQASVVGILVLAIRDSAKVKNMGSLVRLLDLKSRLYQLLFDLGFAPEAVCASMGSSVK